MTEEFVLILIFIFIFISLQHESGEVSILREYGSAQQGKLIRMKMMTGRADERAEFV